jgi:hypothetical protein
VRGGGWGGGGGGGELEDGHVQGCQTMASQQRSFLQPTSPALFLLKQEITPSNLPNIANSHKCAKGCHKEDLFDNV